MTYGPVEAAVRADIARLGDLDGIRPSLAEIAYSLARYLDSTADAEPARRGGPPPRDQTAAVAKELRSTLADLTAGEADDLRAGQARILHLLSAPVRDAADAG